MSGMRLLLYVSVAGVLASTSFVCLVVFASLRFRRRVRQRRAQPNPISLPPVTLLKPLCGLREPKTLEASLSQSHQLLPPAVSVL